MVYSVLTMYVDWVWVCVCGVRNFATNNQMLILIAVLFVRFSDFLSANDIK